MDPAAALECYRYLAASMPGARCPAYGLATTLPIADRESQRRSVTVHGVPEPHARQTTGIFRDEAVRSLSEELSQQIEAGGRREAFNDAIHRLWWGVGDSKAAFQQVVVTTKAALDLINASEIYSAYEALLSLEGQDAATELLNEFIAANQERRGASVPSEHLARSTTLPLRPCY